jgi:hypothetical protein
MPEADYSTHNKSLRHQLANKINKLFSVPETMSTQTLNGGPQVDYTGYVGGQHILYPKLVICQSFFLLPLAKEELLGSRYTKIKKNRENSCPCNDTVKNINP